MLFCALALAYILGSIPFGLLLTRAAGLGDIRQIGSGNIGATNVLRTGNKKIALATLLLDAVKGYAAVKIGYELGGMEGYAYDAALLAALFVVVGHIFPVWLKFKGGKGVATAFGVYFALSTTLGCWLVLAWLGVWGLTRYVSLASITSLGFIAPLIGWVTGDLLFSLPALPIGLLVIWRHKENIKRLKNGTEHQFEVRKSA
jgi:glycerol-3-phosphate acyltransferase PlsY